MAAEPAASAPFPAVHGREFVAAHTSDIRQLARSEVFTHNGSRRARLAIASGFDVDLLPDRGLDIGAASFAGIPLAFCTPAAWQPGLLITCGLDHFGPAEIDGGQQLPLHGVASQLVATDLNTGGEWTPDGYRVWVSGRMRQWRMFGEDLSWTRRISAVLDHPSLLVEDVITNGGAEPWPHMVLYHINFGYPLVEEGTTVTVPHAIAPQPWARDAGSQRALGTWNRMPAPTVGAREEVYRHDLRPDGNGRVEVSNPRLGLTAAVVVDPATLPWVWQWKMPSHGTYVLGVEPSNCPSMGGRSAARAEGVLPFLGPGEGRIYRTRIEVTRS